jgi:YegS/Rv2252/BmrU family lipid kinase
VKPLLIANPNAGAGRAGRAFGELRPIAERALGPVDVQMTEAPGHAIALARSAAEAGRELVVAVGGDGTLHEVANGVLDAEASGGRTAVGFIAQGTGGDFRKSLDLPHRLDQYLAAIASGRVRRVDAARAAFENLDGTPGRRWFLNILSAGLGGRVDRFVADASRTLPPTAAYAWASVRAIATGHEVPLVCAVERAGERLERRLDAWAIAVCNGSTFGSGMRIAPMAALDDGRLEVVALSAPTKLAFVLLSRKLYTAEHLADAGVTHFSGEQIEISVQPGSREEVLLDVDGEPLGRLPVKIEIAPGVLRLRA